MTITMSEAFQRIVRQRQIALKEGAKIIRAVIARNPTTTGYTTHQLYELAHHEPAPPGYLPLNAPTPTAPKPNKFLGIHKPTPLPFPPHPEHPVKSVSFLKNSILPFLESTLEIRKVHTKVPKAIKSSATSASTTELAPKDKGKEVSTDSPDAEGPTESAWFWKPLQPGEVPTRPNGSQVAKKLFAVELNGGEDLSHLSKKRAKERRKEILGELHALKVAAGIENYKARSRAGAELRIKQETRRLKEQQELLKNPQLKQELESKEAERKKLKEQLSMKKKYGRRWNS